MTTSTSGPWSSSPSPASCLIFERRRGLMMMTTLSFPQSSINQSFFSFSQAKGPFIPPATIPWNRTGKKKIIARALIVWSLGMIFNSKTKIANEKKNHSFHSQLEKVIEATKANPKTMTNRQTKDLTRARIQIITMIGECFRVFLSTAKESMIGFGNDDSQF